MPITSKYVHTNLIARDWQFLAKFYCDVFNCVPVPPERHYKGPELERGTGVPDTELHGVHLRLPGYNTSGPTLEIYTYTVEQSPLLPAVNRPGFGHIAFSVQDVRSAVSEMISHGGSPLGEIVTLQTSDGARVTWCYMRDPEGNIIELQSWER